MCASRTITQSMTDKPRARRHDIVVHEIDGEAILYDPRTGNSHRLNETALEIFGLCDGATTEADIAESLGHRYDESKEVLGEQVRAALSALDSRGLLESCAGPSEEVSGS